jgi:phosphatidylserine/phosphatidylglycerophosphate/cardiolipin synthase-like enzyme
MFRHAIVSIACALSCALALAAQPFPDGARFDIGFSPKQGAQEVVLKGIGAARKSILVAAYGFTSRTISGALLDAHRRGVDVSVVADGGQNADRYSAVRFLANQGIPVRLNDRHKIAHSKYMVIDGRHVQTGSFNYSAAAANDNAENVILIWDVPAIAERYAADWKRLRDGGRELKPAY